MGLKVVRKLPTLTVSENQQLDAIGNKLSMISIEIIKQILKIAEEYPDFAKSKNGFNDELQFLFQQLFYSRYSDYEEAGTLLHNYKIGEGFFHPRDYIDSLAYSDDESKCINFKYNGLSSRHIRWIWRNEIHGTVYFDNLYALYTQYCKDLEAWFSTILLFYMERCDDFDLEPLEKSIEEFLARFQCLHKEFNCPLLKNKPLYEVVYNHTGFVMTKNLQFLFKYMEHSGIGYPTLLYTYSGGEVV